LQLLQSLLETKGNPQGRQMRRLQMEKGGLGVLEVIWYNIDAVHPNNYNPNVMSESKFEALCDFLRTQGAEKLDPIWVKREGAEKFEIIDGEHRWRAAKAVGWKRIRGFEPLDIDVDSSKAFNVRKNRERGKLDAEKMGKILYEEYHDKDITQNGIGQKYGMARETVRDYILIYENRVAIREKLNIGATAPLGFRKARNALRELKHPEKTEEKAKAEAPVDLEEAEKPQGLKQFLANYAEALEKIPGNPSKDDDVKIAIDFFKKLLTEKKVVCPICGESHLQWRCGHDF
jgi:ParB/RepB/Spo0J family partition protein